MYWLIDKLFELFMTIILNKLYFYTFMSIYTVLLMGLIILYFRRHKMLSVIALFLFGCTGKGDDSSDTAA